jgi:hypothetical protein
LTSTAFIITIAAKLHKMKKENKKVWIQPTIETLEGNNTETGSFMPISGEGRHSFSCPLGS